MTANSIITAPSILFLGAGASKPFGKMLMGEFVDWFRRKDETGFGRSILGSQSELLNALCEKSGDLEFLIEELDSLSSKDYLTAHSRASYPHADSLGPGSPSTMQSWPEFSNLATEAKSLLADLRKEIYRHYRTVANPSERSKLADVIGLIRPPRNPMVVFTTNYDPLVEALCGDLDWSITDGFVDVGRTYVWSRRAFDEFVMETETSLVLLKLHGSANWMRDGDRIVRSLPIYGEDPDYPNVMIYPATRKVAVEDPFFTAYDYLEKCLNATCLCLVVGYSFRDYDTLMRFKSASLANSRLTVAVLDPNAEAICQGLAARGIRAVPICYALADRKFGPEYVRRITEVRDKALE